MSSGLSDVSVPFLDKSQPTINDVESARHILNQEKILHLVQKDPSIPHEEKHGILDILNSPDVFGELFAGAAGAVLAKVVSKFLNLDKKSQTLLSLAGFGAGSIIAQKIGTQQGVTFDPKTRTSQIQL